MFTTMNNYSNVEASIYAHKPVTIEPPKIEGVEFQIKEAKFQIDYKTGKQKRRERRKLERKKNK